MWSVWRAFQIGQAAGAAKKYAGSKGLMPQDLKPLNISLGVTTSTNAFVNNLINEARLAALLLHSLCRSLFKRGKALFPPLEAVRPSGSMTSVKSATRTGISTASVLHSVTFDRGFLVFEPSTISTTQPYSFCFGL